jgi:hypothetical protein
MLGGTADVTTLLLGVQPPAAAASTLACAAVVASMTLAAAMPASKNTMAAVLCPVELLQPVAAAMLANADASAALPLT